MDLSDVLWVGGAQGAGKSSIARAIAYRFDLQVYSVDHRTWTHSRATIWERCLARRR